MVIKDGIYGGELVPYIEKQLAYIKDCDDGGGIAFAYQRILDALHDQCDEYINGKPSFVDEYGGI